MGEILMIRLIFVEDDPGTAERLEHFIHHYFEQRHMEVNVASYNNAEDFLAEYRSHCDLLLMDIRLPGMNGMDAAREVRRTDSSVCIIFITSMAQYAVNGYEVNALDFVIKPVSYPQFSMKMDKAIRILEMRKDITLSLPYSGGIRMLPSALVSYIEVQNHDLIVHAGNEEYHTRESLNNMEHRLEGYGFVRISISCLVNMKYISELKGVSVILVDGTELFISRSRKKAVYTTLTEYLGGSI